MSRSTVFFLICRAAIDSNGCCWEDSARKIKPVIVCRRRRLVVVPDQRQGGGIYRLSGAGRLCFFLGLKSCRDDPS